MTPPTPEIVVPDVSGLLIVPTCRGLITEPVDIDGEAFREMNALLREAMQYRRPPDELLRRLRAAHKRLFSPFVQKFFDLMRDHDCE